MYSIQCCEAVFINIVKIKFEPEGKLVTIHLILLFQDIAIAPAHFSTARDGVAENYKQLRTLPDHVVPEAELHHSSGSGARHIQSLTLLHNVVRQQQSVLRL